MISSMRNRVRKLKQRFYRLAFPVTKARIHHDGRTFQLKGWRGDHIIRQIERSGTFYENDLLSFIARRYGTGGVYVDAGAYIGNHTLFFSQVCQAEQVVAFEPFLPSFRLLSWNIHRNQLSNATARNVALGERAGRCSVKVVDDWNRGSNEVEADSAGNIRLSTIDQELSGPVKLIKIDTEGLSLAVLRGCRRVLATCSPVLVVEVHPEPFEIIAEYLGQFGYRSVAQFNATPTYVFEV